MRILILFGKLTGLRKYSTYPKWAYANESKLIKRVIIRTFQTTFYLIMIASIYFHNEWIQCLSRDSGGALIIVVLIRY